MFRAAIIDLRGLLDRRNWETSAASIMHSHWFTDCKSLSDALQRPVLASIADKRLGITLAAMRQSLWRKPGGGLALPMLMERRPENTTDSISWIDTSVMPCDCLTKKMKPDVLCEILDTNIFDPRQTEDAKAQKANRQKQRKKTKLPPIAMLSSAPDESSSDPDDSDVEYLNTGETDTDFISNIAE